MFGTMVLGLVLAVPFAMVLVAASDNARRTRNAPVDYVFATYIVAFVLAITTHELGHLLAGWAVGFQFSSIAIGPISLVVEYGRLKVRFRRSLPAGGYAGMHISRIRRLRRRLLVFVAGGPTANLLIAGVAIFWLVYLPPKSNWLAALGDMFWMASAILGIINLVPFRAGALYADGARILWLLSSLSKSRRWMCLTAIASQSQDGIRPSEWKRSWIEAAAGIRDGSIDDFAGNWIAYAAANDREDAPAAALHLERCLELINLVGPWLQDLAAMEAAVFTAWFRENPATAEAWFKQVKKSSALPKLLQMRAKIAFCCARNDFALSLLKWQEALEYIERLPPTPTKDRLIEGFREWRDEIQERAGQRRADSISSVQESTALI
ncbi:MAG TPA: site-2 protease family protein [Candidatus Sulfotelmatobacter sp.]|nr:site-2 protease family protein [Candidatus Sulfotelmatobacter sp.]